MSHYLYYEGITGELIFLNLSGWSAKKDATKFASYDEALAAVGGRLPAICEIISEEDLIIKEIIE